MLDVTEKPKIPSKQQRDTTNLAVGPFVVALFPAI